MAVPVNPRVFYAERGKHGIQLVEGPPSFKDATFWEGEKGDRCRVMCFSSDGVHFAYCNGSKVEVLNLATGKQAFEVDKPFTELLKFSPKGTHLALWQQYKTRQGEKGPGECNLSIYNVSSGSCIKEFIQKRIIEWCPQWSVNEDVSARNVNNEVQFFEGFDFSKIHKRMHMQKVAGYSLSPGTDKLHIIAYVPSAKNAPAHVRMYRYPNFDGQTAAIANRSFLNADNITFQWNCTGTTAIIIAELQQTAKSYYAESSIHVMNSGGQSMLVPLGARKSGPLYQVTWHPDGASFCAVYGFVPSVATIFNARCESIFEFEAGYRNAAAYSPFGDMLAFSGFGNMRGGVEVWHVKNEGADHTLISKPQMEDTNMLAWCPDNQHILSATTAPRLRVGNGLKVWHYSGALLYETSRDELWHAEWQPAPRESFQRKEVQYKLVAGIRPDNKTPAAAGEAYRPPGARGKPKIDDEFKAKTSKVKPVVQDLEKKTKNINKKLDAIKKLKERQAAGEKLELNQIQKIKTEKDLLDELKELTL